MDTQRESTILRMFNWLEPVRVLARAQKRDICTELLN